MKKIKKIYQFLFLMKKKSAEKKIKKEVEKLLFEICCDLSDKKRKELLAFFENFFENFEEEGEKNV